MSRLSDLIDANDRDWSEDELVDWIVMLPESVQTALLTEAATVRRMGGDVVVFLSQYRRRWEAEPNRDISLIEKVSAFTTGWFLGGLKRGNFPDNNRGDNGTFVANLF